MVINELVNGLPWDRLDLIARSKRDAWAKARI
jgi:hypothetical protein